MLPARARIHFARRTSVLLLGMGVFLASAGISLGQSVASSVICVQTDEWERGLYRGKPFQDWIEALHAPDANIRREAAHSLNSYNPHAHFLVPSLFDTLKDPDPEVRRSGAQALGLLANENDMASLLERARDGDERIRASALEALGPFVASTGGECHPRSRMTPVPEPVLSVLIEALDDTTHLVQLAALSSLGRIGPDAVAASPRLRVMLREAGVANPAFLALFDIVGPDELMKSGTDDALSAALRATRDQDGWSQLRAVKALGSFGRFCAPSPPPDACGDANVKAALRALEGALKDGEATVRFQAGESLGDFGARAEDILRAWCEVLKKEGNLAIPSGAALDKIGPAARPTVVTALLEFLRGAGASRRDSLPALMALRSLSPEATRSGILMVAESLKEKDRATRIVAAYTLGELGSLAKPAIPALLSALEDPDPAVRSRAASSLIKIGPGAEAVLLLARALRTGDAYSGATVAEVLGQMGPEASGAIPELIGALNDPSERIRQAAGSALRRIGPPASDLVPALRDRMRDEDAETRLRAVSAAGTLGITVSGALVSELTSALEDSDRRVRYAAVHALHEIARTTGEAVPALALRVRDEDPMVRVAAVAELGEACRKAEGAVPALVQALKDPEPSVRWPVLNALENCGAAAAPAVPGLIEALKDDRKENRQAALRVVGRIGPKARLATVPLIGMLQSDDEEERSWVRQALGSIGPDPDLAVPAYIEWLEDRTRKDRWMPAYALGRFETAERQVAPALGRALRDEDGRVRKAAAISLSELVPKSTDSLRVLAEALADPAPAVRQESVQTLAELGPQASAAVPDLARALRDSEPSVRLQAATALGNIGSQASRAIPALKKAAKDKNPEVRAEATRVLGILSAKP